jgi:uncharacterized protein YkwD
MNCRRFAALSLSLVLGGCIIQPIDPPVAPPPSARDEVEVFSKLVNEHRKKVGCKPLTWVGPVAVVAQQHSEDMFNFSFFSHINHLGKTPFDRLKAAGIRYRVAAENIAAGQRTAEQVLHSWLTSSGHRRNIENCELTQHGIGLSNNHWTHMLVTLVR